MVINGITTVAFVFDQYVGYIEQHKYINIDLDRLRTWAIVDILLFGRYNHISTSHKSDNCIVLFGNSTKSYSCLWNSISDSHLPTANCLLPDVFSLPTAYCRLIFQCLLLTGNFILLFTAYCFITSISFTIVKRN